MKKPKEYYSTSEVAERVGVTRKTVFVWIRQGKVEAEMIGGVYLVPARELARLEGR